MVDFERQRRLVVERLERMGFVRTAAIKAALLKVRREQFVPRKHLSSAYVDTPLPIPGGATISAPHM